MTMPHLQYLRIEAEAGGVWCSDIAFMRAALRRLSATGRSAASRTWRKKWIASGLQQRAEQRSFVTAWRL